jgi:quercetin dioxygenase-like cupin family protein
MSNVASPSTSSRLVAPLEGDAIWFNGALQNVKLPGEWSDDALSLVEVASTRGRATGLHTDPSHETFYVLEGELLFHVDGEEHLAPAGQTVAIRRGVPHAFLIVSETARFLVMNTPGTQERFFRAGGEPALDRDFATAPPPNLERTMAAAKEHGVELLGPPPFAPDSVRNTSG